MDSSPAHELAERSGEIALPTPPAPVELVDGRGRHNNHHFQPGIEHTHKRVGGFGAPGTAKRQITVDLIIDFIIANPRATQAQIGEAFGYSVGNIRVILASDAFQARYLKRQQDVVDPIIAAKIEDRINSLAHRSAEIVQQRLDDNPLDHKYALEVFKESTKAAGLGQPKPPQVNTQFVVHLPGPASSSEEWVTRFQPTSGTMVVPNTEGAPSESAGD